MQDDTAFIIDDTSLNFAALPRQGIAPGRPVSQPPPNERLLCAILYEVEVAGTLIACTASVLNHAQRLPHRSLRLLSSLPAWLPPKALLTGAERTSAFDRGVPLAILNRLLDLASRLGVAHELTLRHCASVASSTPLNPTAVDELAGLWSLVCEAALELIQDLEAELPPERPVQGTAGNGASAERLLAAAALGASPCININGAIEIPGWIERRAERRHRVRLDCELLHAGKVARLRTVDLSRQGAGLAGPTVVEPGARASLVIGRAPELCGTVVWRTAESLGFRFDVPFPSVADLGRRLLRP